LKDKPRKERPVRSPRSGESRQDGAGHPSRSRGEARSKGPSKRRGGGKPEEGMDRYRIDVGRTHGVKPGNIVGAIANEAELDSEHIGYIDINDDYSTIDLPSGMPKEVFQDLKRTRVCGQALNIALFEGNKNKAPSKDK